MVIVYYEPAIESPESYLRVGASAIRATWDGQRTDLLPSLEAAWQSERRLPRWEVYAWDSSGFSAWRDGHVVPVGPFDVPEKARITFAFGRSQKTLPIRLTLAHDTSSDVLRGVLEDENLPEEALVVIAGSPSDITRQRVASHKNASASLLAQLALDGKYWVRMSVADNKNTDRETLLLLQKDTVESVRAAADLSLELR